MEIREFGSPFFRLGGIPGKRLLAAVGLPPSLFGFFGFVVSGAARSFYLFFSLAFFFPGTLEKTMEGFFFFFYYPISRT